MSAAAAKSLQSCLTLCDPIDGSPPGSPVPGILQARTLEWLAISFSNAWKWKVKVKSLSRVRLLATPLDCSPPGSSIHGIFQAWVLEWGAIAFSPWTAALCKSLFFSVSLIQVNSATNGGEGDWKTGGRACSSWTNTKFFSDTWIASLHPSSTNWFHKQWVPVARFLLIIYFHTLWTSFIVPPLSPKLPAPGRAFLQRSRYWSIRVSPASLYVLITSIFSLCVLSPSSGTDSWNY